MKFKAIINNKKFTFFYLGNLLAIAVAMVTQLLIPKIISVEEFGIFKTFTLYLAYTSLFHFGYKDGLYIWFCNHRDELKTKTKAVSSVLFYQQIIVTFILFVSSLFFTGQIKMMIRLLSFATFFNVAYTFFEIYFQSKKKFKPTVYFKLFREISLLLIIFLLFTLNYSINVTILISSVVVVSFFSFVLYWLYAKWEIVKIKEVIKYKKDIKKIYQTGIHLLIGNFTHQLSINVDKLFVSIFFSSQIFGIYAFGTTFFVLANMLLASVSTFILPYLFDEHVRERNALLYEKIILYPFKIIPIYILYFFTVIFVINNYYADYVVSIKYFAALNLALVFNIGITIIQNNFLKSLSLEKIYSKINLIIILLLLSVLFIIYLFNIDFIFIPISISVSFLFRFLINDYYIRNKLKLKTVSLEMIFWLIFVISFYLLGLKLVI